MCLFRIFSHSCYHEEPCSGGLEQVHDIFFSQSKFKYSKYIFAIQSYKLNARNSEKLNKTIVKGIT